MQSLLLSGLKCLGIPTFLFLLLLGCQSAPAPQSVPAAPPQSASTPTQAQPTEKSTPATPPIIRERSLPQNPPNRQPEHGPMNYNPPSTMIEGESIVVDVAIRRPGNGSYSLLPNDADAKSQYGLQGTGPMQGVEVLVADHMQVNLSAGEIGAFDVVPLDHEVKSLPVGGHAEWHWRVTALKPGPEHLILHSQRVPYSANGHAMPPIDDGTRATLINVTVLPKTERIRKGAVQMISDNWGRIVGASIGTSLGAVVVAWWKAWWNKRHPKEPKFDD